MKLAAWMARTGISNDDFADRIGKDKSTVSRWAAGLVRPRWNDFPKIRRITKGRVTANDFVDGAAGGGVNGKPQDRVGARAKTKKDAAAYP